MAGPDTRRTPAAGEAEVRAEHPEQDTDSPDDNTGTSPVPGFPAVELGRRRWVFIPGRMSPLEVAVLNQSRRGELCRCGE